MGQVEVIEALNVRIDGLTKRKAKAILDELHLSMTDAINIYFKQIILNKGLPFPVRIPNAITAKAIEDTDQGIDVETFDSVDDLLKDLTNAGNSKQAVQKGFCKRSKKT